MVSTLCSVPYLGVVTRLLSQDDKPVLQPGSLIIKNKITYLPKRKNGSCAAVFLNIPFKITVQKPCIWIKIGNVYLINRFWMFICCPIDLYKSEVLIRKTVFMYHLPFSKPFSSACWSFMGFEIEIDIWKVLQRFLTGLTHDNVFLLSDIVSLWLKNYSLISLWSLLFLLFLSTSHLPSTWNLPRVDHKSCAQTNENIRV